MACTGNHNTVLYCTAPPVKSRPKRVNIDPTRGKTRPYGGQRVASAPPSLVTNKNESVMWDSRSDLESNHAKTMREASMHHQHVLQCAFDHCVMSS